MKLIETNMNAYYDEKIDGKTSDVPLTHDDAKLYHRLERPASPRPETPSPKHRVETPMKGALEIINRNS